MIRKEGKREKSALREHPLMPLLSRHCFRPAFRSRTSSVWHIISSRSEWVCQSLTADASIELLNSTSNGLHILPIQTKMPAVKSRRAGLEAQLPWKAIRTYSMHIDESCSLSKIAFR